MTTLVTDQLLVEDAVDARGFWRTKARFARPGIQEYPANAPFFAGLPGAELLPTDRPVRVLRDEAEVYDPESMATFEYAPITDEHEGGVVDSQTARGRLRGLALSPVTREPDGTLSVPVVITDAESIRGIALGGKAQLSAGYSPLITIGSYNHPKYGPYDARMTRIRGNHISLTVSARGGPSLYVGDTADVKKEEIMNEEEIKALQKLVQDSQVAEKVAKTTLARVEAERDALMADLAKAKAAVPTAHVIDSLVAERIAVMDSARRLKADLDATGKTLAAIKREAVAAAVPTLVLDSKSDDYISAAFDLQLARVEAGAADVEDTKNTFSGDGTVVTDSATRTSAQARAEWIAKNSGRTN